MAERLVNPPAGQEWLCPLKFTEAMGLCRLTIRVLFTRVADVTSGSFPISTITSPFFSEFVLELGGLSSHPDGLSPEYWGRWESIDRFLNERFAKHGHFKLIIRTGECHDPETFQRHAKETFPLLASVGCIRFEVSHSVDIEKYWP